MADVLAGGKAELFEADRHCDLIEQATNIWEKTYAINHCPNCDMEDNDPADSWKEGRNSDYVGPDADSDGLSPSEDSGY